MVLMISNGPLQLSGQSTGGEITAPPLTNY
ncbi:MAG: hypothetical protein RIR86_2644 [Acidobacteriota bacterium]|jgi:hypothetical protein